MCDHKLFLLFIVCLLALYQGLTCQPEDDAPIVSSHESTVYRIQPKHTDVMTQKWLVKWEDSARSTLEATAKSLAMVSIQWDNMDACVYAHRESHHGTRRVTGNENAAKAHFKLDATSTSTPRLPFTITIVASKSTHNIPTPDQDQWPSLHQFDFISHNISVNKQNDVWTSDVGVFLDWHDELDSWPSHSHESTSSIPANLYTKLSIIIDTSQMHDPVQREACFANLQYTVGGPSSIYTPEITEETLPECMFPNRWYLPVFVVPNDQPDAQRILLSNIHATSASDEVSSDSEGNIRMYVAVNREPTSDDEVEFKVVSTRKALTVSPLSPNQRVYVAYRFVPKQNQSIHYSSHVKSSHFKFGSVCPHGCGQDFCNYETGKCICNYAAGRFGPTCEHQSLECNEGASCQVGKGHGHMECTADGKLNRCVIEWCESAFFGPNDSSTACQLEMPFFFAFGLIIISSLFSIILGCICGICGSRKQGVFSRVVGLFKKNRSGVYSTL